MVRQKNSFSGLKYVPTIFGISGYFLLFLLAFFLFLGRKSESLKIGGLLDFDPEFYTHTTNFSISLIICLVFGFTEILFTGKFKNSYWMGLLLIAVNFIYELFIPLINTQDIIDAYYGLAGTLIPFVYFYFLKKFGIAKNPLYKEE
ncbi:MAG: hypothetical protein WBF83_10995 [Moheibacter sp.]